MKKLLFAVMLALSISIGIGQTPTLVWAAETVPIQKEVEVMPPRTDSGQRSNSIAMQAVWDSRRSIWRRQIIPFNGATVDMVTEEMKRRAEKLLPSRKGVRDWESWQFTVLYPVEAAVVKTLAANETAEPPVPEKDSTAKSIPKIPQPGAPAPPPPPPAPDTGYAELKAKIENLKAEVAAAKPATKPAAKPAVRAVRGKKEPVISPLAACRASERKLGFEKAEAEKSLGECQAALDKAGADLKAANSKLEAEKKARTEDGEKAKLALANTRANLYALSTVIWLSALFFLAGLMISAAIGRIRKKKTHITK